MHYRLVLGAVLPIPATVLPPLTGQVRLDYIHMVWQAEVAQAMPGEERRLPQFCPSEPYWDAVVETEYNMRRHSFFPTRADCETPNEWLQEDELSFEDEKPKPALPPLPPSHAYH